MNILLNASNKLFLFFAFVICVNSEECPTIKTVSDFKPAQYLGKWYEIEKYPQLFELDTKCVTATYSLNANGTVAVHNEAVLTATNTKIEIKGYATPSPSNSANLTVHFPGLPFEGKYWVIDTDYTNYSLVYSCSLDINHKRIENAWILCRKSELSTETVNKLTQELVAVKSTTSLFKKTVQTGCQK